MGAGSGPQKRGQEGNILLSLLALHPVCSWGGGESVRVGDKINDGSATFFCILMKTCFCGGRKELIRN